METKLDLLHHLIRKTVIKKFEDIEDETDSETKFREELLGIKKWNVSELDEEVNNVKQKISKIEEFLSNIINEFAISFGNDKPFTVDVNLFIHKIFIHMGGFLYYSPEIMKEPVLGIKIQKLDNGIKTSIKKAIFDVFPLLKVLESEEKGEPMTVEDIEEYDDSVSEDKKPTLDSDSESDSEQCNEDSIVVPDSSTHYQQPPPVQPPEQQPVQPVQHGHYSMMSDHED
jgi:hypothetical protein